jgi:hypothetical protein
LDATLNPFCTKRASPTASPKTGKTRGSRTTFLSLAAAVVPKIILRTRIKLPYRKLREPRPGLSLTIHLYLISLNPCYLPSNIAPTYKFKSLCTSVFTMSQSPYSSLPPGPDDIRLLRLMPHKNEKADIKCQLVKYSLQDSGKRNHLYEALSYAWGGSGKPLFISIKEHKLPVTVNLHTALSRLRDCSLTRIIWIDAVCIYSYRTTMKHLRNLRFIPQFSKGFNFCLGAEKLMLRTLLSSHSICPELYLLSHINHY